MKTPSEPIRILIADDERMSRVALRSMLTESGFPMLMEEASDGIMMMEKTRDFSPHIGIIDIRMPLVDGLKAIEKAKALSPYTQWIILSGYTEFEYAKHAVTLNVHAYLVKPVNPKTLVQAILEAKSARERAIDIANAAFEESIGTVLRNPVFEPKLMRNPDFGGYAYEGWILTIDVPDDDDIGEVVNSCLIHLKNHLYEYRENGCRQAILRFGPNEILFASASPETGGCGGIQELFSRELSHLRSVGSLRLTSFAILPAEGISAFHRNIAAAGESTPMRLILGTNESLKSVDFPDGESYESLRETAADLLELQDERTMDHDTGIPDNRESIAARIRARDSDLTPTHIRNLADYVGFRTGSRPETSDDPVELLTWLISPPHDAGLGPTTRYVDEVLDYIAVHYREDIGINTIAPMLGLSPNYLSTLFHKKTGTRFARYLASFRIRKAKDLLALTDMFVKEIAIQVGYRSVRHFTNTFVQQVGRHPSEFRKAFRSES